LLGKGRLDASGAYIDGVGLSEEQAAPVVAFLTARVRLESDYTQELIGAARGGDRERFGKFADIIEYCVNADADNPYATFEAGSIVNIATLMRLEQIVGNTKIGSEGIDELDQMVSLLMAQGYGPDRIVIDPSVVRGLGYYTGPVFEAELTFDILDDKGRKRQFGSVAGGGRYDDLVKRFTGQAVPATGVSIGVDRLLAALREKGRIDAREVGPVVVTVMDRERMAEYQAMVAELRQAGIRAEVYLGNPKQFGNQLKYADKRQSPIAVIEGGDEKARGVIQIKDLILGSEIAETATHEEWKYRPSQFEVPRDQMLAKVREILDAHGL